MIKESLNNIIGIDTTHIEIVTSTAGEPVDSQLIIDYGYIGSVALVIVVIFCLFKMIGGAFKK